MSAYYKEIITVINTLSPENANQEINIRYHGNNHYYYGLNVPIKRKIAKDFLHKNSKLSGSEFVEIVSQLVQGISFEEKTIAGYLVEIGQSFHSDITTKNIDSWLDHLMGWAEIDCLCQSSFKSTEILQNWLEWEILLDRFAKDKSISKRRASLVLLNKAVEQSSDERLSTSAFRNIDHLKIEKDIIISKAISWLLRSLVKNHRSKVENYLENNKDTLPRIAIRETHLKLNYGVKNYRINKLKIYK